jgi:hypothetical protein
MATDSLSREVSNKNVLWILKKTKIEKCEFIILLTFQLSLLIIKKILTLSVIYTILYIYNTKTHKKLKKKHL